MEDLATTSREPASAVTRTDRRRARTRQKLIASGRRLIGAKGVAGLRIQDITEVEFMNRGVQLPE